MVCKVNGTIVHFVRIRVYNKAENGGSFQVAFIPTQSEDAVSLSVFASGFAPDPYIAGFAETDGSATHPFHAIRYDLATDEVIDLGTLGGPGAQSFAQDINIDGSVVVGQSVLGPNGDEGVHGFRWTEALGMQDIGTLAPTGFSEARGVNDDGTVVVGVADAPHSSGFGTVEKAFRWTLDDPATGAGTMAALETGDRSSIATDVNADGSVVVGGVFPGTGGQHAFRWTETDGIVDIGTLPGLTSAAATAVSADGTVIVGAASDLIDFNGLAGRVRVLDDGRAFRWTEATGIKDLNDLLAAVGVDMTGITLMTATNISRDGEYISGEGLFPSTSGEAVGYTIRYVDATNGAAAAAGEVVNSGSVDGTTDIDDGDTDGGGTDGGGTDGGSDNGPDVDITTDTSQRDSVDDVANAQFSPAVHLGGTASYLAGALDRFDSGSFADSFVAFGSFTGGVKGRWAFANGFSVFGGSAYSSQHYGDVDADHVVITALGLRYTAQPLGRVRPFIEATGWFAPEFTIGIDRHYANGTGTATGHGDTTATAFGLNGTAGIVFEPFADGEIVLGGRVSGIWLALDAYAETPGTGNPFPAVFGDRDAAAFTAGAHARVSAQLGQRVDLTLSGTLGRGFDRSDTLNGAVIGVGTFSADSDDFWFADYGGRLGVKLTDRISLGASVFGTSAEGLDTHVQAGFDIRVTGL
ncbi:MAG: hypothetical protein KDJ77_05050 [Rhodobiaceae bacterium]|nr:hypothetical protein [Rhodobiaceae bacterium]